MNDSCRVLKLPGAFVQENGIIRKGDGQYIGRLDDVTFEEVEASEPKPKTNPMIENNFRYHASKEGQPAKYEALRAKAKELAYLIDELVPNSREKSVAMTNLEQACFWANAGIARNE